MLELIISTISTRLEKLTDDAVAYLFVTKFSTIFDYNFRLIGLSNGVISHIHRNPPKVFLQCTVHTALNIYIIKSVFVYLMGVEPRPFNLGETIWPYILSVVIV